MTLILNWFIGSLWGRLVAGLAVGLVVLSVNNAVQRSKGATAVVAASKEKGKAANAKNEKVRAAARQPGAAERLRQSACRDCD